MERSQLFAGQIVGARPDDLHGPPGVDRCHRDERPALEVLGVREEIERLREVATQLRDVGDQNFQCHPHSGERHDRPRAEHEAPAAPSRVLAGGADRPDHSRHPDGGDGRADGDREHRGPHRDRLGRHRRRRASDPAQRADQHQGRSSTDRDRAQDKRHRRGAGGAQTMQGKTGRRGTRLCGVLTGPRRRGAGLGGACGAGAGQAARVVQCGGEMVGVIGVAESAQPRTAADVERHLVRQQFPPPGPGEPAFGQVTSDLVQPRPGHHDRTPLGARARRAVPAERHQPGQHIVQPGELVAGQQRRQHRPQRLDVQAEDRRGAQRAARQPHTQRAR